MKCVVQFSGGKDSLATLIYAAKHHRNVIAVFCDTEWEHEVTYQHVYQVVKQLGVELVILKGQRGFLELAKHKGRFPSTKARFCTEELKVKPFIDWILGQKENLYILQGIRKDESDARSKMNQQCHLFKHYFQPYKVDEKTGRKRYHTYRKEDVKKFCRNYGEDIFRPIFQWTAEDVFAYIKENGFEPNPLYKLGFKRVGCFPCIMCTHQEIREIANSFPETVKRLKDAEAETGTSFFPPKYIPAHQCSNNVYPTVEEVIKYVDREKTIDIFEPKTCKSFYSLCE